MKVEVEKILRNPLDIDAVTPLHSGGEGSVYAMPGAQADYLLKIYHESVLTRSRQEKVLDLCSKYETFAPIFKATQYAFPQKSAQDQSNGEIVGFAMAHLGTWPQLDTLCFGDDGFKEAGGCKLTDDVALALIYDLYVGMASLHTSNIVLGDLNPSNILYNFKINEPVFLDLDAVQTGKHSCSAHSEKYLDPLVESAARNADNSYKYSPGSDCFSLAVIAYELFVGASPFEFRSKPPLDGNERKRLYESLLCYLEDPNFAASSRRQLPENNKQNELRMNRLRLLQSKDTVLYKYFVETFVKGKRESLLLSLPKSDPRNPGYVFASKSKVKTIADTLAERKPPVAISSSFAGGTMIAKEEGDHILGILRRHQERQLRQAAHGGDPLEFILFVNNLGLDYNSLVNKGIGNA